MLTRLKWSIICVFSWIFLPSLANWSSISSLFKWLVYVLLSTLMLFRFIVSSNNAPYRFRWSLLLSVNIVYLDVYLYQGPSSLKSTSLVPSMFIKLAMRWYWINLMMLFWRWGIYWIASLLLWITSPRRMKRTRSLIIRWQFRRCAPTWLFSHDPFLMMISFYFIAKCLELVLKILKRMFYFSFIHSF